VLWKTEKPEQIALWKFVEMFKRKSSGVEHDYELKSYMNKR